MPDVTRHLDSADSSSIATVPPAFTGSLFDDLHLSENAFNQALQQGLDKAFSSPDLVTPTRVTSSADFTTPDNDDDEWMDEEDFTQAPRKPYADGYTTHLRSEETPTQVRAPAHWNQTPRAADRELFGSLLTSPDSNLSDVDANFLNSLLSMPTSSAGNEGGFNTATGADGQPCLDLEIDLAELDLFFQRTSQPDQHQHQHSTGQYTFNFDGASSDSLLHVPSSQ